MVLHVRSTRRNHGIHQSTNDRFRTRARAVQAWALAHGRPADAACLAVICHVKAGRDRHPVEFDRWIAEDVEEMVWVDVVQWCARLGSPVPEGLAEALWTYIEFLDAEALLLPGSDDLDDLRSPLLAYTDVAITGRRRPGRIRRRLVHTPAPNERLAPVIPLRPRRGQPDLVGA
jgi:hypothetical protein